MNSSSLPQKKKLSFSLFVLSKISFALIPSSDQITKGAFHWSFLLLFLKRSPVKETSSCKQCVDIQCERRGTKMERFETIEGPVNHSVSEGEK